MRSNFGLPKTCYKHFSCVSDHELLNPTFLQALVEILLTRSTEELKKAKTRYLEMFGVSLEADVADDTSGDFRKLVYSLSRVGLLFVLDNACFTVVSSVVCILLLKVLLLMLLFFF